MLENQPDAGHRPGQPLEKDAAEEDRELGEIHVVLARGAVKHQRAKQHLNQQRIADVLADHGPRRPPAGGAQIVVIEQSVDEALEVVDFGRKGAADFGAEKVEIVLKSQRYAGKGDRRPDLGDQGEIFPAHAELAQQLGQGALFVPGGAKLVTACRPTS